MLDVTTLWWITQTFPTSVYAYREVFSDAGMRRMGWQMEGQELFLAVPMGFSAFPKELTVGAESWVAKTGRCVFYRAWERGGHFVGWEMPAALAGDLREFLEIVGVKAFL